METKKIPINGKTLKNNPHNEVSLTSQAAECLNFYLDEAGGITKRPGLSAKDQMGAMGLSVDSLYWWIAAGIGVGVSHGDVYRVTNESDATALGGSTLNPTGRCTFAVVRDTAGTPTNRLFIANGGRIVYTDGFAAPTYIADADAPTRVSHVVHLDSYLICNDLDAPYRFRWAEVGTPLNWLSAASASASAEGEADDIVAIKVRNRELFLFGTNTIEIWENDGASPFSRINGGLIESGVIAPHSIVVLPNTIFWLDHNNQFVEFDGRSVSRKASPYDAEIQAFAYTGDCYGEQIEMLGMSFLVFHFPSADRTYVYNVKQDNWERWGTWDSTINDYRRWRGNCHVFASNLGKHIVGGRDTGLLYELTHESELDGSETIRPLRRTGYVDHGIYKRKRSEQVRIRLNRGHFLSTTPKLLIRWNNDGAGWSPFVELSLGAAGDYNMIARLDRTGIYRTRQWEIVCTDAVPLNILDMEEDFTILTQ